LKAIAHPLVHVIGHPTGRIVNGRPGLEPAMNELFAAAKEHGTALEINAHHMRLDLRDVHVKGAVDAGCMLAIDCDVHGAEDFNELRYGVMTAQRGWLPKAQCLNCMDAKSLDAWRRRKRG
jgi:DNA polymerase (family 10)